MPRKPATIRRMQNAIKENDIALMREAIADGADVNRKDRDGYPYLIRALLESYYDIGYYDIAKLLIERGADVNLRGKNDMTAIGRAVSSGNMEMVRMLIEYGADVNVTEPPVMITPLHWTFHWACRADSRLKKHYTEDVRTSIVSMLIDHGAFGVKSVRYQSIEKGFGHLAPTVVYAYKKNSVFFRALQFSLLF
ncbi:MAG: ankyrin repeat domain-containing protein [Syntrophorhabdaceae bacterium]|nr:ankyrin repeat domain-containing protein [Syntrophorhabdaceae bacterium]